MMCSLTKKFHNGMCNNQESGSAGQGMKAWTMVANTDSLLDDESRKAIMLLRGLKGTHLFIPRIVIRELDSMKQREGTVNKGDHHRLRPRLQQAPERREGCRPVQQRHAKIKAMAEGLPCEGAFRESLMDPSSRRFMWAASAPRGSAWSCLDASALAENYYNSHHHHHAMKRRVVPARPANRRRNDG
ncbi:FHA domain-containing protein PS1-like isoform X3 [Miscanthus floridulus]|uniref:FHA domain-containing protein PS1-like isoform X3 n=2 Tax=Miscanthus floridulus TaxID=154761 RepID=UPI00345AD72E